MTGNPQMTTLHTRKLGTPVMISRETPANRTGTNMMTSGYATRCAIRGILVILAVLGSLAPVTTSSASRATLPGSVTTSQTTGGWDEDETEIAPLRAEATAFAGAVETLQRAVLDAGDVFASSLDAIIGASDVALQPDGTYPRIVGIGPSCECRGFRRDLTFALEGANPGSAIVFQQKEAYFNFLVAARELFLFTLPDAVPHTPDSLRLCDEVHRWNE